ncbi:hypothetical protein [Dyella sp. 20L07]|uniref:hypothetical protein n=1 Tax=Dyella sp. 20L07 TaxID=3384240 RepID=UPI003D2855A2
MGEIPHSPHELVLFMVVTCLAYIFLKLSGILFETTGCLFGGIPRHLPGSFFEHAFDFMLGAFDPVLVHDELLPLDCGISDISKLTPRPAAALYVDTHKGQWPLAMSRAPGEAEPPGPSDDGAWTQNHIYVDTAEIEC